MDKFLGKGVSSYDDALGKAGAIRAVDFLPPGFVLDESKLGAGFSYAAPGQSFVARTSAVCDGPSFSVPGKAEPGLKFEFNYARFFKGSSSVTLSNLPVLAGLGFGANASFKQHQLVSIEARLKAFTRAQSDALQRKLTCCAIAGDCGDFVVAGVFSVSVNAKSETFDEDTYEARVSALGGSVDPIAPPSLSVAHQRINGSVAKLKEERFTHFSIAPIRQAQHRLGLLHADLSQETVTCGTPLNTQINFVGAPAEFGFAVQSNGPKCIPAKHQRCEGDAIVIPSTPCDDLVGKEIPFRKSLVVAVGEYVDDVAVRQDTIGVNYYVMPPTAVLPTQPTENNKTPHTWSTLSTTAPISVSIANSGDLPNFRAQVGQVSYEGPDKGRLIVEPTPFANDGSFTYTVRELADGKSHCTTGAITTATVPVFVTQRKGNDSVATPFDFHIYVHCDLPQRVVVPTPDTMTPPQAASL